MTTHHLKTDPLAFHAIWGGTKTAEVRRNDRDYQVMDGVCLHEWDRENPPLYAEGCKYPAMFFLVTDVTPLDDYGCPGMCLLSFNGVGRKFFGCDVPLAPNNTTHHNETQEESNDG